jgi:hypothetical protein
MGSYYRIDRYANFTILVTKIQLKKQSLISESTETKGKQLKKGNSKIAKDYLPVTNQGNIGYKSKIICHVDLGQKSFHSKHSFQYMTYFVHVNTFTVSFLTKNNDYLLIHTNIYYETLCNDPFDQSMQFSKLATSNEKNVQ